MNSASVSLMRGTLRCRSKPPGILAASMIVSASGTYRGGMSSTRLTSTLVRVPCHSPVKSGLTAEPTSGCSSLQVPGSRIWEKIAADAISYRTSSN